MIKICRWHRIGSASPYALTSKDVGLEISDAKSPKEMEEENAELKPVLAAAMLDNVVLKTPLSPE